VSESRPLRWLAAVILLPLLLLLAAVLVAGSITSRLACRAVPAAAKPASGQRR